MIVFSETLFSLLVHGALALTVGGAAALGILFARDWRSGRLW